MAKVDIHLEIEGMLKSNAIEVSIQVDSMIIESGKAYIWSMLVRLLGVATKVACAQHT